MADNEDLIAALLAGVRVPPEANALAGPPWKSWGSYELARQPPNWFGRNVLGGMDSLAQQMPPGAFEAMSVVMPGAKMRKYPIAPRGEWYGDANYETTGGRMVNMAPDEFLSKARPMKVDDVARENIDDLKRHIESGKTLDPLALHKGGKEDGRHRAHAAKELGIDQVPVLIWE